MSFLPALSPEARDLGVVDVAPVIAAVHFRFVGPYATIASMSKTQHYDAAALILDRKARITARKRVVGLWSGRVKEMIRENRKLRKEWSNRVKRLGW